MRRPGTHPLTLGALVCLAAGLPGCAVVTVTTAAVSVTASAVGLAADAAVGTAKVVGAGVGLAADALTGEAAPASAQAAP